MPFLKEVRIDRLKNYTNEREGMCEDNNRSCVIESRFLKGRLSGRGSPHTASRPVCGSACQGEMRDEESQNGEGKSPWGGR